MPSVISCKLCNITIDSFIAEEGELINDVVRDILLKDPRARSLIGGNDLTKINVFRLKKSLDDPTLLFWIPFNLDAGEWPYIFFLQLSEGKLLTN